MISVRNAEITVGLITFFIAYIVAVTLAGFVRAWSAKKMGDNTAEYLGLLTLNPLAHIDIVGVVFLFLFYFGWGRYVPINPFNIRSPLRNIKLFIVYLSDTLTYFFSALIGIIILVLTAGPRMVDIARHMLICVQHMSHLYLIHTCPTLSSLAITLSFIVIAFIYLNVILGVLNLILNIFSLGIYFLLNRSSRYDTYNYYLIILIPIILIFLFSEPLRILAIHGIAIVGYWVALLVGLAR